MSLWQKFSDLQGSAEQCRSAARVTRAKCDRIQSTIESLLQTQQHERSGSDQALEQVAKFRARLSGTAAAAAAAAASSNAPFAGVASSDDADDNDDLEKAPSLQEQLDRAEADYNVAVTAHHQAVQKELLCKATRQEQIQQALEQSHSFQLQCQQWQLQATGLETAVTMAALNAAGKGDEAAALEGLTPAEEPTFIAEEDAFDENDPTTWVVADDDDELQDAVADYKQSLLAQQDAMTKLNVWKTKQAALQAKRRNSLERSQQLEVQLSRIASDCVDLQSEAAELQHLTLEDVALAQAYRSSTYILNRPWF